MTRKKLDTDDELMAGIATVADRLMEGSSTGSIRVSLTEVVSVLGRAYSWTGGRDRVQMLLDGWSNALKQFAMDVHLSDGRYNFKYNFENLDLHGQEPEPDLPEPFVAGTKEATGLTGPQRLAKAFGISAAEVAKSINTPTPSAPGVGDQIAFQVVGIKPSGNGVRYLVRGLPASVFGDDLFVVKKAEWS